METSYITITKENLPQEHICCAFSDKKCEEGYKSKKEWLEQELEKGYIFRKLNARAKVFIEYVPAEQAWIPIDAPGYLMVNCLWVSGQYKGQGHAKRLLQSAIDEAKESGKHGLATVVGTKKFHFMSDTKWFIKQGFKTVETLPYGFSLLAMKLDDSDSDPCFRASTKEMLPEDERNGLVAYYSNRCPFTEHYVGTVLVEECKREGVPLKIVKIQSLEQAQDSPTPATIFSLYKNGKFVTTDISCCMGSKLTKIIKQE
ncbi:MAG: GNAT family N-acetyltransferase [Porphyromonas sp.]|nr:GNAT family N-acetyltransferase [Porphyromonas sp.]